MPAELRITAGDIKGVEKMRVEIDDQAKNETQAASIFIRLYPETNEDMRKMEWGIECGLVPLEFVERIVTGPFHYLIKFP